MKTYFASALLGILLFFSCQETSNTDTMPTETWTALHEDTTYSHISQSDEGWMIENNSFYVHENDEEQKTIFKISEKQSLNTQQGKKEFAIQPIWTNSESNLDYIISTTLNDYSFQQDILSTRILKNADGEDFYAIYNLANGNHLLDYTYAKLDVQFSQSEEKRYIGFVARSGLDTLAIPKNTFGTFSYASQTNGIQKLLITLKDETNRAYIASNTPDMSLVAKNENTMLLNGDKTLYFSNLEDSPTAQDIRFDVEMTTFLTEDYESIPFTIAIIDDKISLDSTQYFDQIFNIELLESK